jgi:hypothetical protein
MKDFQDVYETLDDNDYKEGVLRYFFVSQGERDIVKAIEYQYVKHFDGRPVINLAFGDYDLDTGTLSDEETSNNGDAYKVLGTVLNSRPCHV